MNSIQEQMNVMTVDEIKSFFNSLSNLTVKDWWLLEQLLNRTQNNFVNKLRCDYPQLSEDDVRVVMLLRTHPTHEQIAQIDHVELSSLRKRRYRIKKKMQVECSTFSLFIKDLYVDV